MPSAKSAVPRAIAVPCTVSCDIDVIVTFFTSTSLCSIWLADHLRDQMILAVLGHQLRGQNLRKEVVVERILLRDGVPAHRVAIVRPIGKVCANLSLPWTVAEIVVLNCLGTAHFIDADVAINGGATSKSEIQPHRSQKQNRSTADDEAVCLPFGVVGGIDLIADLVREKGLAPELGSM